MNETWHFKEHFRCPEFPPELKKTAPTAVSANQPMDVQAYCEAIKARGSEEAKWLQTLFKWAALIIIVAHVVATIIAVTALKLHSGIVPWLLGAELVLLAVGFGVHEGLHRSHSVGRWAMFRVVAEVARSIKGIGPYPVYLEHLFALPFPFQLRPLLRSINVLHLQSTAQNDRDAWQGYRNDYVHKRLVSAEHKAQIPYNTETIERNQKWLRRARRTFLFASSMAFVATLTKLLTLCDCLPLNHEQHEHIASSMGFFAVVLPVIAVAALSLAAAFDLDAKLHTAQEMLTFLNQQRILLENASSEREFGRLVIETESLLLGETVNWYARRSFLGIA